MFGAFFWHIGGRTKTTWSSETFLKQSWVLQSRWHSCGGDCRNHRSRGDPSVTAAAAAGANPLGFAMAHSPVQGNLPGMQVSSFFFYSSFKKMLLKVRTKFIKSEEHLKPIKHQEEAAHLRLFVFYSKAARQGVHEGFKPSVLFNFSSLMNIRSWGSCICFHSTHIMRLYLLEKGHKRKLFYSAPALELPTYQQPLES